MNELILIICLLLFATLIMVTVAESSISCYKCANSSALAEHDWRIFNITIDPYAYKPCAPKFDHSILEVVQCKLCASIVDKSTQKRKIIYRGCFDKKIRLEEKRKINGERRFYMMATCQRSLCNSAISSYGSGRYDNEQSWFIRLMRWFRLYDTRLDELNYDEHELTGNAIKSWFTCYNDWLFILASLHIYYSYNNR